MGKQWKRGGSVLGAGGRGREKSTGPTRLGLKWLQLFPPKPKKATVGPASNRAGGALLNTPPALNSVITPPRLPLFSSSSFLSGLVVSSPPLITPPVPRASAATPTQAAGSEGERGLRSPCLSASVHSRQREKREREARRGS